jgi:excisionase family DNA binding protein
MEQRMSSLHPGVTGRASGDELEPLAVSPRQACRMLNVGNTYLYELLKRGELENYWEGKSRKITMRSIRARQERQLAAARGAEAAPEPRPRGRPRKTAGSEVRP